jgi:hypothetical protein
MFLVIARNTAGQDVADQRSADKALGRDMVEVAVADREVAGRRERGRLSEDQNGAAGGVAAEQGALRALGHFQSIDIGEVKMVGDLVWLDDAVEVERNRRIGGGPHHRAGDAADGRLHIVRRLVDLHARHREGEILHARHPGFLQLLAGLRHNRDRNVPQALRAPLGRDDNLTDGVPR